MSRYYRDPVTGEEKQIAGIRSTQEIKNLMLEFCYPIGSMYISTVNVSPETFLGGTWVQHSGYMLRGASSGVTANHTGNDGGADSVEVSSVASHSHTQYAHGHTQYGISVGSGGTAPTLSLQNDGNVVIYYSNGVSAIGLGNNSGRGSNSSINIGGYQNRGVSNETAINLPNGSNYTVNTLPKYKNVYIWERTA